MEDALSVPVVAGILMQHVVWSRLKQTVRVVSFLVSFAVGTRSLHFCNLYTFLGRRVSTIINGTRVVFVKCVS